MTSRRLRSWIWIVLSITIYFAMAEHAMDRGMQPPLSPRYTLYAVPAAVSLLRGYPHDYTAQMSIAAYFIGNPNGNTDEQIKQALAAQRLDNAGLWFVSGDDKGLIDLTYASFWLFGARINSVLLSVLLLVALSSTLFAFQFWRSNSAMALLVSTLCGLYAVLFTFGISDQATSIAEPRFLGVISLISTLHLMLVIQKSERLSFRLAATSALQTALIVLVVHLRSAEFWQIVALTIFGLCNLAIDRKTWKMLLFVTFLVSAGLTCLTINARTQYHPRYSQNDVTRRVFWHNTLVGLAINPTLQSKYNISPLDDVSITEAVRKQMIATGRTNEAAQLYPSDHYAAGNFKDFQWGRYEREARSLFFRIAMETPLELARTYLLLAPKVAWGGIEDLRGVQRTDKDFPLDNTVLIAAAEIRAVNDLYFSLLRPVPLVVLAIATILTMYDRPSSHRHFLLLIVALIFCLAPAAIATPAIQYLQLPLTIAAALLYLTAITLVTSMARTQLTKSGTF
jgi:hypothetical protein